MSEALIQISKVSGTGDEDVMNIEIVNNNSVIRLTMPMLAYAELITGQAKVSCEVKRWHIEEG